MWRSDSTTDGWMLGVPVEGAFVSGVEPTQQMGPSKGIIVVDLRVMACVHKGGRREKIRIWMIPETLTG